MRARSPNLIRHADVGVAVHGHRGILINTFGCTGSCVADLNADGVVDATDMGILLAAFGSSCEGQLLAYDYRNQLIQHFDYGTDHTLDIQRDAFGRAIRLRFDDGTTVREQRRVYGDHYHWTLLETHDDAALEPTMYLGSGWLDDFVAVVSEDAFTDATPRTLLSDEMGTVQALVSPGGAVLERYEYGPYGEQVVIDAPTGDVLPASAFGVLIGFQGHPSLGLNGGVQGLVEMRFRTYSPGMGRFLTRDPAGHVDGPNIYQFGIGNPLRRIDSLGLSCLDKCHAACPPKIRPRRRRGFGLWDSPLELAPESSCADKCRVVCEQTRPTTLGTVNFGPLRNPVGNTVRLDISATGVCPDRCHEIGIVQLHRKHIRLRPALWTIDSGHSGISDRSPAPPYYNPPTAPNPDGTWRYDGIETPYFQDSPSTPGRNTIHEFIIVVMCTAGPDAGAILAVYPWTIGTGSGPSGNQISPALGSPGGPGDLPKWFPQ